VQEVSLSLSLVIFAAIVKVGKIPERKLMLTPGIRIETTESLELNCERPSHLALTQKFHFDESPKISLK
jgi:hypothetical protein